MLKVLSNLGLVSSFALSPEEIPEQTEPVQQERRLKTFVGKAGPREIIWDLDLLAILAVGHHGIAIDTVHVTIAPAPGARLGAGVGVEFDRFVLNEGTRAVVITTFQEVVVDVGIEVVDHHLGTVHVHVAVVTRSRRSVVHHGDTTRRASNPGVHPTNVHLIHGGERWDCSHLCLYTVEGFKSENIDQFQRASTDTGQGLTRGGRSNAREREEIRSGEALRIFGGRCIEQEGALKRMYAWATALINPNIFKALRGVLRQICEGRRRLFSEGEPRDRYRAQSRRGSRKQRDDSVALRYTECCQRMAKVHEDQRRGE